MSLGDWFSMAVILFSLAALYVQLKRLGATLTVRRFCQVSTLIYFIAINLFALTTSDVYLLRSGILSRVGVLILLTTIIMDKGDC